MSCWDGWPNREQFDLLASKLLPQRYLFRFNSPCKCMQSVALLFAIRIVFRELTSSHLNCRGYGGVEPLQGRLPLKPAPIGTSSFFYDMVNIKIRFPLMQSLIKCCVHSSCFLDIQAASIYIRHKKVLKMRVVSRHVFEYSCKASTIQVCADHPLKHVLYQVTHSCTL